MSKSTSAAPPKHRVYSMAVGKVYPLLVAKAEKNGRAKAEVGQVTRWLTGYSQTQLDDHIAKGTTYEDFFSQAPRLNPLRAQIKGTICGVKIEEIKEDTMREIRYLDKLVDELAKGKAMDKVLRTEEGLASSSSSSSSSSAPSKPKSSASSGSSASAAKESGKKRKR